MLSDALSFQTLEIRRGGGGDGGKEREEWGGREVLKLTCKAIFSIF